MTEHVDIEEHREARSAAQPCHNDSIHKISTTYVYRDEPIRALSQDLPKENNCPTLGGPPQSHYWIGL